MQGPSITERTTGRWKSLLPVLVPDLAKDERFLKGRHMPCPMCGGEDRFRFTDHGGDGVYICNQCGAGNGVQLVMRVRGIQFAEAAREIERLLPSSTVHVPQAARETAEERKDRVASLWMRAKPLTGLDAASRYLKSRGLTFSKYRQVRFVPAADYYVDGKRQGHHPAMVAHVVSPDASQATLHYTYLDRDGRKAKVDSVRKFMAGPIPSGGAVRLANSAETMGIAEGIETAMSAMVLYEIPVWAACDAGKLLKWQPPKSCKHVIVFADNDDNFAGQVAAYGLANRLVVEGFAAEVRLPDRAIGGAKGADWNDVLMSAGVPAADDSA